MMKLICEHTAFRRLLHAYPKLLLYVSLPWALNTALQLSGKYIKPNWWNVLFYIVGSLALFPVYHMELPAFFYRFFREEPVKWKIIGAFYKPPLLSAGLLVGLIAMAGYIVSHFLPWSLTFFPAWPVALLLISLLTVSFWLDFRLGLTAILLDSDPRKPVQQAIQASWSVTGGKFLIYMWRCFSRLWPFLLILALGIPLSSHLWEQGFALWIHAFKLLFIPYYLYIKVAYYSTLLRVKRETAARLKCK